MGIIFVGGVHGVGKTDFCKRLAQEKALSHMTASALIKSLDASAVNSHTKAVGSVSNNQQLLINAVLRFISGGVDKVILDGHFAIPNAVSEFELVSADVFKQLQVEGIVCCYDDPINIYSRRTARDGNSLSEREIGKVQKMELNHAQFVAQSLKRPFFAIKAFDVDAFSKAIHQIWRV